MSPLAPRIRALRASGMSLRAIAREVGCGIATVHKWSTGVAPSPQPAVPPPKPPPYYLHCAGPRACNWPISEQRPWRFCPEPAEPGAVYCRRHEALAMPPQRRVAA